MPTMEVSTAASAQRSMSESKASRFASRGEMSAWLLRKSIGFTRRKSVLRRDVAPSPGHNVLFSKHYSTRKARTASSSMDQHERRAALFDSPGDIVEPPSQTDIDPLSEWKRLSLMGLEETVIPANRRFDFLTKLWDVYHQLDVPTIYKHKIRKTLFELCAKHPHAKFDREALKLFPVIPRWEKDTKVFHTAIGIIKRMLRNGVSWEDNLVTTIHKEAIRWGVETERSLKADKEVGLRLTRERDAALRMGPGDNTFVPPPETHDDNEDATESPSADVPSFNCLKAIWHDLAEAEGMSSELEGFGVAFLILLNKQYETRPAMYHARSLFVWRMYHAVGDPRFVEMSDFLETHDDSMLLLHAVLKALLATVRPHEPERNHAKIARIAKSIFSNPTAKLREDLLTLLTRYSIQMIRTRDDYEDDLEIIGLTNLHRVWTTQYDDMPEKLYVEILILFSRTGQSALFQNWWNKFLKERPNWEDTEEHLWLKVYIHARRADVPRAEAAFVEIDEATKERGRRPPVKVWSSLILAYCRSDELEQALWTLNQMKNAKLVPDTYCMHPILEIMAKRGLHARVEAMVKDFNAIHGWARTLPLHTSLMLAFIRANELKEAERHLKWLQSMVGRHAPSELLVEHYNRLLSEFAIRRDTTKFSKLLQAMRSNHVLVDSAAYEAVYLLLILHRQTDYAWSVLSGELLRGIRPTSRQYAIILQGFSREGKVDKIRAVEKYMRERGIPRDHELDRLMLQAKLQRVDRLLLRAKPQAIDGRQSASRDTVGLDGSYSEQMIEEDAGNESQPVPGQQIYETDPQYTKQASQPDDEQINPENSAALEEAWRWLQELEKADTGHSLALSRGSSVLSKGDSLAMAVPDDFFQQLLSTYTSAGMMDVVGKLVERIAQERRHSRWDSQDLSIGLLTALIRAYGKLGDYEKARFCWVRVMQQVLDDKIQNSGYTPKDNNNDGESLAEKRRPHRVDNLRRVGRPLPGRRVVLARPLGAYIEVLAKQGHFDSILQLVIHARVLNYVLDNATWNLAVKSLCQADPPYASLAFGLCEEALLGDVSTAIPTAQIATQQAKGKGIPLSLRSQPGLAHLRNLAASPWQLRPSSDTLSWLGKALAILRDTDSSEKVTVEGRKKVYVGEVMEIEAQFPETVRLIQHGPSNAYYDRFEVNIPPSDKNLAGKKKTSASVPVRKAKSLKELKRQKEVAGQYALPSPEQILYSSRIPRRGGAVERAVRQARTDITKRRTERLTEGMRNKLPQSPDKNDISAMEPPPWSAPRRSVFRSFNAGSKRASSQGQDWLRTTAVERASSK